MFILEKSHTCPICSQISVKLTFTTEYLDWDDSLASFQWYLIHPSPVLPLWEKFREKLTGFSSKDWKNKSGAYTVGENAKNNKVHEQVNPILNES